MVCKRWNSILVLDTRFAKYHSLYLDKCTLAMDQPPIARIMEQRRKFGKVFIRDVKYRGDTDEFWYFLGKTVTHLFIEDFEPYTVRSYFLADIISKFKSLETIHFGNYTVDVAYISSTPRQYNCKWPTIHHLVLDTIKIHPENMNFFKTVMPNLETIRIGLLKPSWETDFLNNYMPYIKSLGITASAEAYRCMTDERLRLEELSWVAAGTKSLPISYFGQLTEDAVVNKLVSAINCQPELKRVELSFYHLPQTPIKHLKKLHLEMHETVTSFEPLRQFPELQELHIKLSNYETKCFFGHKKILNLNLRKLFVYSFTSSHCSMCHKCMFESYPNLKSFSYESCFVFSVETIEMISKNLREIEELNLFYFVTESLHIESFLQNWYRMPKLRKLDLRAFGSISKTGITKLCKMCPELRQLTFLGSNLIDAIILNTIITKAKKLKRLKVEQRKEPHVSLNSSIEYSCDNGVLPTHCYTIFRSGKKIKN